MVILVKLIQAIILGIIMIFSLMLLIIAATSFIGFLAQVAGFNGIAEGSFKVQESVWRRMKVWFFRYKGE